MRDLPVARDIFVTTPERVQRCGDLVGTILRPALREWVTSVPGIDAQRLAARSLTSAGGVRHRLQLEDRAPVTPS